MRQRRARWLSSLAILAGLAAQTQSGFAAQTSAPVEINSFSGAYLSARVAENDNDLDNAINYYKQALAFAPEDTQLQQSLMLSLIAQGRFEESLPYADKLKEVPDIERFSRLALAVDSFKKKDFTKAQYWLKLSLGADLDKLICGVMTGWAMQGAGQGAEAMDYVGRLEGPEWFDLFKAYHRALIADATGKTDKADAAYAEAIANTSAGGAAPETWMRAAQAYATFLARKGDKDKALSVLKQAEEFGPGKVEIVALRDKITKGEKPEPLVANPSDGASEILLNLATALNRGGGEPFVRLYLEYALALKPDSDVVLVQLAAVAEQLKDGDRAIGFYRRIPAASPLKEVSELQTGLNLADLGRNDEAIKQLKVLVEANPQDMRGYLALGGVYASKQDFRSAAELFDKAVAALKTPTRADWNIFYQRGIAYERIKERSTSAFSKLKPPAPQPASESSTQGAAALRQDERKVPTGRLSKWCAMRDNRQFLGQFTSEKL